MHIERLSINGVRNLVASQLDDCGQFNLIYGLNGAGKTSVLEALSMLCVGRSFKARQFRSVINSDAEEAVVFAKGFDSASTLTHSIGVKRSRTGSPEARLDGTNLSSLSKLASITPLQLLDASSFSLVEGSPGDRRAFLDWGVFHVEHDFNRHWQSYRKCLKQRNSLLRRGKIDRNLLLAWDQELIKVGEAVDQYRLAYFSALNEEYIALKAMLVDTPDVAIAYKRGWTSDQSLKEALADSAERDIKAGLTHIGPHRADVSLTVSNIAAVERLSRGQEKTLVCTLKLAQVALLLKRTGKRCLFLIDDFAAELDQKNRAKLVGLLKEMQSQVFITGIKQSDVTDSWPEGADIRVFHVEHGEITSCSS